MSLHRDSEGSRALLSRGTIFGIARDIRLTGRLAASGRTAQVALLDSCEIAAEDSVAQRLQLPWETNTWRGGNDIPFVLTPHFLFGEFAEKADGSQDTPCRVMLTPADGGIEDDTKPDFKPVFDAVMSSTGFHFDVKLGHSSAAIIDAIGSDIVEIPWFARVSFLPTQRFRSDCRLSGARAG